MFVTEDQKSKVNISGIVFWLFLIKFVSRSFDFLCLGQFTCKIWLIWLVMFPNRSGNFFFACFVLFVCFVQLWDPWLKWLTDIPNKVFLKWRKALDMDSFQKSNKSQNKSLVLHLCICHSCTGVISVQHKMIRIHWCSQTSTSDVSWCLGGWALFLYSANCCLTGRPYCWTYLKLVGRWLVLLSPPEAGHTTAGLV